MALPVLPRIGAGGVTMKIEIDDLGNLIVNGREKFCPFRRFNEDSPDEARCGEWCPLFGEPVMGKELEHPITGKITVMESKLAICQGRVLTGEIIDERNK